MTIPTPILNDDKYTPEQRAYILKYAAGFLLTNDLEMIDGKITPDIMDGFEPPKGLFPEVDEDDMGGDDDLVYEGGGEVLAMLDSWLEQIAKLAGFASVDEARLVIGESQNTYNKYPVMNE